LLIKQDITTEHICLKPLRNISIMYNDFVAVSGV